MIEKGIEKCEKGLISKTDPLEKDQWYADTNSTVVDHHLIDHRLISLKWMQSLGNPNPDFSLEKP